MKARAKCRQLLPKLYQGVTFRDGVLNQGIARRLRPGCRILDAGCGCDAPIAARHAPGTSLCAGVDLVETFAPPAGVSLTRADLNILPFRDGVFDLIFSRSVLEHLLDPPRTFREFDRILKRGGALVVVTPNKYDYASILARLIPYRFHRFFLRSTAGDEVYNEFPTHFRCNTQRAILKALEGTSLRIERISFLRHYPYYLMFSVPLFYLGVAYDRIITALGLDILQPTIYLEIVKE